MQLLFEMALFGKNIQTIALQMQLNQQKKITAEKEEEKKELLELLKASESRTEHLEDAVKALENELVEKSSLFTSAIQEMEARMENMRVR